MFVDSCHDEQLSWCSQQHIVATVEDSVLRTEMTGLGSQEEDAPKCMMLLVIISVLVPFTRVPKKHTTWQVAKKYLSMKYVFLVEKNLILDNVGMSLPSA
jgi:hypothetical protein